MTVQEHLQITIGNLVFQLCQSQAMVDQLKAELEEARKPVASAPSEPPPAE